MACYLASLSFAGPGQLLSGRPLRAGIWFAGELLLLGMWLVVASQGKAKLLLMVSGLLVSYHLACWVDAARCGWHFRRLDLKSSLSRILVMAGLVAVAPLPAAALVYGPGQKYLVGQYSVSESSMATTLLGKHAELRCQACGYALPVGLMDYQTGNKVPAGLRCPMCGNQNFRTKQKSVLSDRVMASKRILPHRWDLLMFLSPADLHTLILKRVVGLPGEELEIIDGEIFIDGQIVSKGPASHEEMWVPMADTRYRAKTSHSPQLRWLSSKSADAWLSEDRAWLFDSADGVEYYLELSGTLSDRMDYNISTMQYIHPEAVHDIRLQVTLGEFRGKGELSLVWEYGQTQVRGTFDRAGKLTLTVRKDGQILKSTQKQAIQPNLKIMLIIRDGYAYISADGKNFCRCPVGPLQAGEALDHPAQGPRLRIAAVDCLLRLDRIQLQRDVHYRGIHVLGSSNGLRVSRTERIKIPPGHYYVLGDNSALSVDSRLGWNLQGGFDARAVPTTVHVELSEGVVTWLCWPPARIRSFR